ncbi:MAG TPA: hypothetical protein VL221_13315 [Bacteroidota bacterium]|nr:hypothetical protein [Bacteroidota bacterium]
MRGHTIPAVVAGLFVSTASLYAFPPSQNALWIQVDKKGEGRTTIALTEQVARELLSSSKTHLGPAEGDNDLITRDMIRDVLEGRRESVEARDAGGTEARIWMKDLTPPGRTHGSSKLVLEIYKAGDRTVHIALPDVEIEAADRESGGEMSTEFGWKTFLPFLARDGGAVYINSEKDDTEIWVFVD